MKRIQVLALLLVAVFLIGLAWILRPRPGPQAVTPSAPGPGIEAASEDEEPEEPQDGATTNRERSPSRTHSYPLADPGALRNEQIARVQFDGERYLLWLTDGRRYELWPSQVDQLPPEVQAKFRYRRGGSRP